MGLGMAHPSSQRVSLDHSQRVSLEQQQQQQQQSPHHSVGSSAAASPIAALQSLVRTPLFGLAGRQDAHSQLESNTLEASAQLCA